MSKAPNVREYAVYTFYSKRAGRPPVKSRISAYTLWASQEWEGCVMYHILAASAREARESAVMARLSAEIQKEGDEA